MKGTAKIIRREVSRSRLEKILRGYESRYGMSSSDFYTKYNRGELGDRRDFVTWAGYYVMAVHSGLKDPILA